MNENQKDTIRRPLDEIVVSCLVVFTFWFEYRKIKAAINFVRFAGHNISVWEGSGLMNRVFIILGDEKAIELFKAIRFVPEHKYFDYLPQNLW